MKVLIAGEGRLELGGYDVEDVYRTPTPELGLVEAMLRRVAARELSIGNGVRWRSVPKYRAREFRSPESRTIAGLSQLARDSGYDAVVFLRDRDRQEQRERDIRDGLAEARTRHAGALHIVGGLAHECADAWVLAWAGRTRTESLSTTRAKAERQAIAASTEEAAQLITEARIEAIPEDAASLHGWLECARAVLAAAG